MGNIFSESWSDPGYFTLMMKKNLLRISISIFISAFCLHLVTRNIDWQKLKNILVNVKGIPVFAGLAISLIAFFLRAYRWQILLSPFQQIPIGTLIRWQIGGLFINNLFPLRMGEFARAYWAGHKSSIPKSSVLGTIVLERIFDISTLALLSLFFLPLSGIISWRTYATSDNLAIAVLLFLSFAILIFFACRRLSREMVLQMIRSRLPNSLARLAENFLQGLKIIKSKSQVLKILILSVPIWCIDILVISVTTRALDLNLSFLHAGVLMVGLVLGVMIPAAPGALGTYETGGVAALTLLGIEKTLALSFVLLLHGVQYIFIAMIGIPVLLLEGFNPKKMIEEKEKMRIETL